MSPVWRPLAQFQFRGGNHCLGATVHAELLEYRGDVCLHRRFRYPELIGYLLVEQALRQHHENANLLRGERSKPCQQLRTLRVRPRAEVDVGRSPDASLENALDCAAHGLDTERLGDEPG